jgi:hypothetical protein
MPPKRDAATELADKMLLVLESQRRLGPGSYPLTLRRLAELTDPAAPAEAVLKAVARKKPFGERALAVQPKDLDAPVALVEDLEQLAASPLLLSFVLDRLCTPTSPTCDVGKLKTKVPPRFKQPFMAAVARRIAAHDLPPGVAVVPIKKKQHLHLLRYELPRPPEEVLAAHLVRVLRAQRDLGGDTYPLTLARLLELCGPGPEPGLEKKALAQPVFKEAVLLAVKDCREAPITLAEDRDLLVNSPLLLETMFRLSRSENNQVFTPKDLSKKAVPALREPLAAAIQCRAASRSLPPTVGCLLQKKKPLLFLLSDIGALPAAAARSAPLVDFARAFDEAFDRLDRQRGAHNFVSLVDLRPVLPVDRPTFDARLQELRRAGRFTLSSAEGRHGISPAEQEAGIPEDGALLLYVSRKLP